ncbi:MAG TPA: hypothetical protein VGR35_14965 [Tepidisphaeraceae bacterium]|nr:hypothetical protein [Tepidisphaeraceae bacterium]
MGKSWLPLKNETLRAFCQAFLATASPAPATYGLVAGDITSLSAATLNYSDALAVTDEPSTRTRVSVAARDMAKKSLIALMRNLYKKVNAANLTDDKRQALGLPIVDVEPTSIPRPGMKPTVAVVSRDENRVRVRLFDPADPNSRAKPPGVSGAAVFTFVGEVAPTTEVGWKFEGNTTRTIVDIDFPASVTPGSKVWITAFWFNPRAFSGPAATPVSTYLPGGAAMAA